MTTDISLVLTNSSDETLIIYPRSLTITRPVCNTALQHEEQSASIDLNYSNELLSWIVGNETIKAVIKDGSATCFTGIINVDTSWKDVGNPFPIESFTIKIKDHTQLLKARAETEIALIDTTVSAAMQRICSDRSISIAPGTTLPVAAMDIFVIEEGTYYDTVLDSLCYQNSCSYYFDEYGQLCLFYFNDIPETPSDLDEGALVVEVEVKKSKKSYTGVKIGYNTITKKENELVYFESSGYNSDGSVKETTIQPGVYYPFDSNPIIEEDDGQIYQSFESGYAQSITKYNGEKAYQRSSGTSLIYTENHSITDDWNGDLSIDRTAFQAKKASVRFLNNSSNDVSLYSLSIRADAWYRNADASVTAGEKSNPFSYDAEFIYTAERARVLAVVLSRYLLIGQFQLTTHTEEEIIPGTYRTIKTGVSGFEIASLAISSSINPDKGIYETSWISVADAKVNIESEKVNKSQSNIQGQKGDDGYTIQLSKTSHVFSADSNGNLSETIITTEIIAYKGDSILDVIIGSLPTVPGLSLSKTGKTITITALSGLDLALSGDVIIPVDVFIPASGIIYGRLDTVSVYGRSNTVYGRVINSSSAVHFDLSFSYGKIIAGTDGSIRTLSSLSDPGNYKNEIANFNNRLYKWNGAVWELVSITPRYLGALSVDPSDANAGDWYAYIGSTTLSRTKGMVYKYIDGIWTLDTNDDHLQAALSDLLGIVDTLSTENSAITFLTRLISSDAFIDKLFANEAFINTLATKMIILKNGGTIKSEDYLAATSGFNIPYSGNVEFNNADLNIMSDNKNRVISIGKNGIYAKDSGNNIIHDLPDNPNTSDIRYGGHFYYTKAATVLSSYEYPDQEWFVLSGYAGQYSQYLFNIEPNKYNNTNVKSVRLQVLFPQMILSVSSSYSAPNFYIDVEIYFDDDKWYDYHMPVPVHRAPRSTNLSAENGQVDSIIAPLNSDGTISVNVKVGGGLNMDPGTAIFSPGICNLYQQGLFV